MVCARPAGAGLTVSTAGVPIVQRADDNCPLFLSLPGRVLGSAQALKVGMVDGIASSVQEALGTYGGRRLRKAASVPDPAARARMAHRERLLRVLGAGFDDGQIGLVQAVLNDAPELAEALREARQAYERFRSRLGV